MNIDNWYDLLLPTNYIGAVVFGVILSAISAFLAKRESKENKKAVMTFASGLLTTLLVVFILYQTGYIK